MKHERDHRQGNREGQAGRRDITGDSDLKREGALEERKGEAKEDLDRADERAQDKADEVADLERKT